MKQSIKNLIIILFMIGACKNTTSKTENTSKKDSLQSTPITNSELFSRETFYLGPKLDSLTTKAIASEDCTSSFLHFLSNSTFVEIVHCKENSSYLKGSYKMQNDSLILNYSNLLVGIKYLGDESKKGDKITYSTEIREEKTIIYKILKIKNKIVLRNDSRFGTIGNESNFKIEINILMSDPVWSMLNPKSKK